MMKTIQTIKQRKTSIIVGFFLALLLAVSGLLAVQNGPSHLAAATVVESPTEKADSAVMAPVEPMADSATTPTPVTENRITEKTEKVKSIGSGEASYYGRGFAGRPTANGETFNPAEMTAAHRTLPFGSKVRVTNQSNGQSIVVRVNDRGPYAHNRVIDLSQGAAEKIGMIHSGTAQVKLELIS